MQAPSCLYLRLRKQDETIIRFTCHELESCLIIELLAAHGTMNMGRHVFRTMLSSPRKMYVSGRT